MLHISLLSLTIILQFVFFLVIGILVQATLVGLWINLNGRVSIREGQHSLWEFNVVLFKLSIKKKY